MKNSDLVPNIMLAMKFTKNNMLAAYGVRDREEILKEYHNFRVFTRFLFIRGNYGSSKLKKHIDEEMKSFMNMLLESGADWSK